MEPVVLDTSLCYYCAGCIGYRWAVKVIELLAREPSLFETDALFFSEILEGFAPRGDYGTGETIYSIFLRLLPAIKPVTVDDFDRALVLGEALPDVSPRAIFRAAAAKGRGRSRICATFAGGFEHIPGIERVNLMERMKQ